MTSNCLVVVKVEVAPLLSATAMKYLAQQALTSGERVDVPDDPMGQELPCGPFPAVDTAHFKAAEAVRDALAF